ncbi:hypothetical protein FQA39_LY00921 [Lamprigera yunnana]|nr:hypothetical protein FQA39_LY00921 [Lamprigera yunnana]
MAARQKRQSYSIKNLLEMPSTSRTKRSSPVSINEVERNVMATPKKTRKGHCKSDQKEEERKKCGYQNVSVDGKEWKWSKEKWALEEAENEEGIRKLDTEIGKDNTVEDNKKRK